jgi:hypothetical protein
MATTTNNGWTTPDDTALVKDGASAIRALGTAIDTTLGVYAAPGLVKLNTTTFSAVASQSVNSVFSTTYQNYRILLDATGSTTANITFRLRVGGVDNSSSVYSRQYIYSSSTSLSSARSTTDTSWNIADLTSTTRSFVTMEIANPFLSEKTGGLTSSMSLYPSGNTLTFNNYAHDSSTSFTSFTLIASSGTMTGNVSVYGYNK